jgi:Dullard-like phosphatase family protein
MLFNLEDLMVLEERLNDIIFALQTIKNIDKKCFNYWNYYYNCSLYKIIEKIFINEEDSNIIRLSINYELMSIMVCYEFSYQLDIANEDICLLLLELIYINHDNLMIICEYILTKISSENKDNIWVLKLQELVNNFKISQINESQSNYSSSPINKINNKTNMLRQKIKNILMNYSTEFSHLLSNFFISLESKTYEEINDFFRLNILRVNNFEGSIMASSYLKKNKYFEPIPAPYITEPSNKPYTLVLDLDETLVNFKIKSSKEGTLRARPFLFGFLEEMGHYYELIVWTSATEAYANTLIDAIEFEKTYFDYVFFREHAIIIGDDFVKDLTRIGRGLDRIIIVDDMPQNFRLQRQNGITIKPFLGDDVNDMALYDLLPIFKHIAEEGNDVRVGLAKYRDEIVKKITSNISKNI